MAKTSELFLSLWLFNTRLPKQVILTAFEFQLKKYCRKAVILYILSSRLSSVKY